MRLIDADALMKKYGLDNATKYGNKTAEEQVFSYDTMFMYEIADMIEDTPTIDPVKHGKWLFFRITCGHRVWKCSVCEKPEIIKYNYCPNCGARMDGELG